MRGLGFWIRIGFGVWGEGRSFRVTCYVGLAFGFRGGPLKQLESSYEESTIPCFPPLRLNNWKIEVLHSSSKIIPEADIPQGLLPKNILVYLSSSRLSQETAAASFA